jgi:Fe-S-cluster containining protein
VSGELCSACGLCCDGTLYGRVVLDTGEAEGLARLRLPVIQDGNERGLPQPCAAHGPDGCTIYEHRPRSCAVYECAVYRQLRHGEITAEAARSRVSEARRLADAVRALLPEGQRRPLVDALAAVLAGETEDIHGRRAHGELLLAAASLAAVCRELDPRFGRAREPGQPREAG